MAQPKTPLRIYHNPRCSKSRETLELLRSRGLEPEVIEYLREPPDECTLAQLLLQLGLEPRELIRQQEDLYTELDLDKREHTRAELIRLMVEHPILIERPIVVCGQRARLGRPPEQVLEIL
ncbi:MAG: arsenate reductase (glutaredoxin) [Candidatus Latescibacteria bacterium]|nr:arsenate reductase (glutaredoxin) [Candidatus Latescibacterota bacterium]